MQEPPDCVGCTKNRIMTKKSTRKPAAKPMNIEGYIPYLLNRVALRMVKHSAGEFAKRKLSVPTWRILATLGEYGTCRFGELASLTSIEPATLSRLLGQLHRSGLISQKVPADDTRAVLNSLTAKGKDVFKRSIPFAYDVESMLLDGVSKADVQALHRALLRMFENLKRRSEKRGNTD